MADNMPSVTIRELSFRYPTRKPISAPSAMVMANITGMASSGPILSCKSSTTMVENDIIEPTDRSRLPLITTKVTPRAMTPTIAEDRTTPMTLSSARKRSFNKAKPIMKITNATRMPCRAKKVPIVFSRSSAIICFLPVTKRKLILRPKSCPRRSSQFALSCNHCPSTPGTLLFR